MTARYLKLSEVCVQLEVDDGLLRTVCDEGLVEVKHTLEDETVISAEHAERLRLITLLMREMDVNLPGVEVILHMHDDLLGMQRQFDEILRTLVDELRRRVGG